MKCVHYSTQEAVRRDRKEGYSIEMISLCRVLDVSTVRAILARICPYADELPTTWETMHKTAMREMRTAERGLFGLPIERYVQAVKGNWCDVVLEWAADIKYRNAHLYITKHENEPTS